MLEGFYHVYAKSLMKHNDLDKSPGRVSSVGTFSVHAASI